MHGKVLWLLATAIGAIAAGSCAGAPARILLEPIELPIKEEPAFLPAEHQTLPGRTSTPDLVARLKSEFPALISSRASIAVACESLLMLWVGVSFFFAMKSIRSQRAAKQVIQAEPAAGRLSARFRLYLHSVAALLRAGLIRRQAA